VAGGKSVAVWHTQSPSKPIAVPTRFLRSVWPRKKLYADALRLPRNRRGLRYLEGLVTVKGRAGSSPVSRTVPE
jgi:hypothetical protein